MVKEIGAKGNGKRIALPFGSYQIPEVFEEI